MDEVEYSVEVEVEDTCISKRSRLRHVIFVVFGA